MTREEAKRILYVFRAVILADASHIEAFDMAIKALEQEPCEDCISRDEAKKALEDRFMELQKIHSNDRYETNFCLNTILELPPVTPQPKIGRWIADVDRWGDIVTTVNGYRCSECNAFNTDKDNFCPNCGAKMVEPQESEE